MAILSQPAFGPRTALGYVTAGSLLTVWTAVWYFTNNNPLSDNGRFWLVGLLLTGLTLVTLGVLLGPLGRVARKSELPPTDAMAAEAAVQQTAAANPNPIAPLGGVAQVDPQLGHLPPQQAVAQPAAAPHGMMPMVNGVPVQPAAR